MADGIDRRGSPVVEADGQPNQWWLVIAAALAVFMASVDMSIVNVALPEIEGDFEIATSMTEWVVLAYLLPLATTAVRPRARGRAMGLITTLGPLGLISGPGLGGMIVDGLGWPWIFFVNVLVSVLVMAVGLRMLPASAPLRMPDRTWFTEAVLLSAAFVALLLALSFTASEGPVWMMLVLVSVPLLVIWLRMPSSGAVRALFGTPGEVGPHLALASAATAIGTVFFMIPYFMQRELGESLSAAGATILVFPAGMALMGPVGGFLGDWWDSQTTAVLGAVLFTVGLALLLPMDGSLGIGDLAWRLFLAGCGNGLFNAPNMAMAMSYAPPQLLATTGSSTSIARQLGFALGPALATLLWSISSYQSDGVRGAMALAALLSALSVIALLRLRIPDANHDRLGTERLTTSVPSRSDHA